MTNVQLYLAIGVPVVVNAAMIGLLLAYMNARLKAIEHVMNERFNAVDYRFNAVDHRFDAVDHRFNAVDQRLTDMRDLWRAELHRVEEVLDARLKHIEEQRR